MSTHPTWPREAEVSRLTANFVAGCASAESEIACAFLEPLIMYLRGKFPRVDPDLCETAASEAIFQTLRRANSYDPGRLPLDKYLKMAACGDLKNLLSKEKRHLQRIPLESVAEPIDDGNTREEEDSCTWTDPLLAAVLSSFTPAELAAIELMRTGERNSVAFAEAMGLPWHSPYERAVVVKRCKDRLIKRLARAVGGAE